MLLLDGALNCVILSKVYFSPFLVSFTIGIHTPTDPIKALSIAHKLNASHLLGKDRTEIKMGLWKAGTSNMCVHVTVVGLDPS